MYKLTSNPDMVIRVNDNNTISYIPADEANRDWVEYQAWLSLGNEPDPAE